MGDGCVQIVGNAAVGARTPGTMAGAKWRAGFTLCEECHRLSDRNQFCPVCARVWRKNDTAPMVCCDNCDMWVHIECDNISVAEYAEMTRSDVRYTCPKCRNPSRTQG